jgi:two-component system cell cycle sensor histidine kinase PleC
MSNSQSTGTDKHIVDRTKRGDNSSRALKDVRYRLNSFQPNVQKFERELLQVFARNQINVIYLFPVLIVVVGAVSILWLGYLLALGWMSMMMIIYGVFLILCRKLLAVELSDIDCDYWHRRFKRSFPVVGLGWAALFIPLQLEPDTLNNQVIQFSVFLCVMAFTTITTYAIKIAAPIIVAPAVLLLAIRFSINLDPVSLTMASVLVIALAFFSVFGNRLYFNLRTSLKNQAEKDQLIAELETASSISEEARRRAEEANLAKSRFLATMSHELRTPLNAILGFSEMMIKEVLGAINNEHYTEYLNDIHNSGTHLLALINEILDLSRVEAGRYNLNEEAVQLDHIVTDCEQLIKLKAKNKDIAIIKHCEQNLPRVWADERSIRQVILNLLSNALKFTPTAGTIWIKIGWTAGGGQYVSIRDNGSGIAEEEIPVVLSSFGQGSIAIKSAEQGAGLGLPIVQALMEKHGGAFELKSKLRAGTEVIISLPSTRVMEIIPPIAQATPSMATPEPKSNVKKSIFRSNRKNA